MGWDGGRGRKRGRGRGKWSSIYILFMEVGNRQESRRGRGERREERVERERDR